MSGLYIVLITTNLIIDFSHVGQLEALNVPKNAFKRPNRKELLMDQPTNGPTDSVEKPSMLKLIYQLAVHILSVTLNLQVGFFKILRK